LKKHDRTPHLDPSDFETEDLLSILSRNLPDDPHDYIFGKSIDGKAHYYIYLYILYLYIPYSHIISFSYNTLSCGH